MSVFLTPEGQPFYGGTYFPPTPRYGMPSFKQVLTAVADGWQNRRQELVASGQGLVEALREGLKREGAKSEGAKSETVEFAFQNLLKGLDRVHGGWGSAPKFP
ncbi:MAG TPA: thioredoxin domain-containing protein, partial [Anaerolineae bacterium]|nr:thioredoxin domain-containing protein [Anaerolineae bacterium]